MGGRLGVGMDGWNGMGIIDGWMRYMMLIEKRKEGEMDG